MKGIKGSLWIRWNAESSNLGEKVGREKARLGRRRREGRIMVGMRCDAKVMSRCSVRFLNRDHRWSYGRDAGPG